MYVHTYHEGYVSPRGAKPKACAFLADGNDSIESVCICGVRKRKKMAIYSVHLLVKLISGLNVKKAHKKTDHFKVMNRHRDTTTVIP